MTDFMSKVACAKRGGPSFLETVRVDPESKECPEDFVPCSDYTTADNTVCVKEKKNEAETYSECPIIDIGFIEASRVPSAYIGGYDVTVGNL